jgi:bifunctional UDP-N-acetylglucosamine pyrophosphorylase/glucosamine-1-phosphate N-acetyltransferase
VTIVDPATTIIGPDVTIGLDTVIEPSTILEGSTQIGARCKIGPFSRILNATIGDQAAVLMSHVDRAQVGSRVWIGPYAHLRPQAILGDGVKIGNFVEIKNAQLLAGSKANHLAYIGDASIGEETNIGAGTITCNYDGFAKHRTVVGANAFVGSNSTLVAPVTIGDGAMIAAGSVVNKDVPADAAAFGRARQETKPEWAAQWRILKQSKRQSTEEA